MTPQKFELLKQKLHQEKSLVMRVKVRPKSGKQEISSFLTDGTLKVKLKSAPEQNKANEELIVFLSECFEIPSKNVTIMQGQTSSLKIIKLSLP